MYTVLFFSLLPVMKVGGCSSCFVAWRDRSQGRRPGTGLSSSHSVMGTEPNGHSRTNTHQVMEKVWTSQTVHRQIFQVFEPVTHLSCTSKTLSWDHHQTLQSLNHLIKNYWIPTMRHRLRPDNSDNHAVPVKSQGVSRLVTETLE